MNERERRYQCLFSIIASDDNLHNKWRRFYRENRGRMPLYPGSKIEAKAIELMSEFLVSQGYGIN